ncbi:condensation domain-containing protein, partial [Falsihalocynthiibacter sp. CO-5D18]|uniref:condensation domain-containing protein n=1 Tax=Falsihalocynthiibacter sp. CO-5D18 TaxID=3240872 RepID=UPI00350FAEC8
MKALQQNDVIGTFPTSIGQKRCWFMEQMHPGNRGLNLAVRWELRGPVSSEMVATAFNRIIARHEILRTCFAEQDGEPVQQVVDHVDFKLDDVDVRALDEADRIARINAIAVEHAEQPFDMEVPCLLRVVMVRTNTQKAELLIAVHNAIFDGFSIGV